MKQQPPQTASLGPTLFGLLNGRKVGLREVFADATLPPVDLLGTSTQVTHRFRMVIVSSTEVLMQIGLPPALFDHLGLPEHVGALRRNAIAAQYVASFMATLRGFFAQDVEVHVDDVSEGCAVDAGKPGWTTFGLGLRGLVLPSGLADPYAARLCELIAQRVPRVNPSLRVRAFLGHRLFLSVAAVRQLREGDVLLAQEAAQDMERHVRLYVDAAGGPTQAGYVHVSTISRQDGRIEHLAPGPWLGPRLCADMLREPVVEVDIVCARLTRWRTPVRPQLAGECLHDWSSIGWLALPEMLVNQRPGARVRPVFAAGQAGFEVVELFRR